ncbi:hypothetical protein BOTBODRAFT_56561 [Botryobasidium botryosum FD-172 SS1]|uniref:Tubulin-specific chaperone A n=1 Tax=Botryobasidium botryosum (strain FD-172 SS1) TaxID=930990 RepID=A0A067MLL1_BOTB1|nr:hypothetical protein BOTBODRAFT_56561 [Botryobasidium botryosum FD-172 SS1]
MSDIATIRRQLKIKTGVVKRLTKEVKVYEAEVEVLQKRLDKFIEESAEEWDIKNGRKVLEEGMKMIPDTQNRLSNYAKELVDIVGHAKQEPAFNGDADLAAAEDALKNAGFTS